MTLKVGSLYYDLYPYLAQIKKDMTDMTSQVTTVSNKMSELNFTVDTEIRTSVRKAINSAKNELQFKYSGGNLVNDNDVKDLIKSKIERSEVLSYLEVKSSKQDTQNTVNALDIMHRQLKHLCVIIIELLRQEVAKYTKNGETEQALQNKCLTTMYQSISIAKWIDKLDVKQPIGDDMGMPKELSNYQNLVMNTLDDISDLAMTRKNDFAQKQSNLGEYLCVVYLGLEKYFSLMDINKNIKIKKSHMNILSNHKSKFRIINLA